ncbi:MAG TPA: ATP-binding protein [Actinomycetota bacterium]|nr:ATP-binding protein [Actinomycetota bacterium]
MNVFSSVLSRLRGRAGTVRARTTTLAVVVVGGSLVIGGLAMRTFLERSLTSTVREAAFLQARDAVDGVAEGEIERPIDVLNAETDFVQVLDSQGEVFDYSANLEGRPPVALLRPQEVRKISVPFEEVPFLAVALQASLGGENYTVISGKSLETVTEPVRVVSGLLLVGIPLLVVVGGLTTWRVVRRALMPVESIRAEVEGISTGDLDRRVPVPKSEDEIARLGRTMNAMLARLEESQRRQRRFVSDASHELRSPVSSIRQHAEVALSHPEQTPVQELADVVLEENLRLQRVVEDLLLLTKMDEGTLRLRTEPVDLDDLVFEEAGRLRSSTKLQIDTSAVSAGRVLGDREQLARLVRNLTDNAARHGRGTVALALHQDNGVAVLEVDDDGQGIPPTDRERIFERFVRLEEARDRDSGGSGLGLAIVAEIAAAHGGKVSVRDAPLGGARFEVELPSVRE